MTFFEIVSRSKGTKARAGKIYFARGVVNTPGFMSIGTKGSVKGLTVHELQNLGAEMILGNTYHLWLTPGTEIIRRAGGLHSFNNWKGPILTDSGGYQLYSLSKINQVSEEGVVFSVPENGEKRLLTPEISMDIQTTLGSDVILPLDELVNPLSTAKESAKAMERTHRWAVRSKKAFEDFCLQRKIESVMFGIPQGAKSLELRKVSAEFVKTLDLPGYSIGGVSHPKENIQAMLQEVDIQTTILEETKPRHLLGIGNPMDIVQSVAYGADLFDCVYPTRNARHGSILFEIDETHYEEVQITSKRFAFDFSPLNVESHIPELREYSKSYLRHLLRSKELLGYRLATLQNLDFYYRLMSRIRTKIQEGTYDTWWKQYRKV